MPTIRATTTSALVMPCTSSAVVASTAALTGASARPNPKPPSTSGTLGRGAPGLVCPTGHEQERHGAQAIPAAVTTPAAGSGQVAAHHGAHGQRDQEPDQRQRRLQLRVAVDRGAGEERDVDQRRDEGGADEEAHQQRPPGRRRRGARGTSGASARRRWTTKRRWRRPTPRRYQAPWSVEDLDLRVGGGEGQHHPAERRAEGQGAEQVGLEQ